MAAPRESLLVLVTLMVPHLNWLDHVFCSQDMQARLHSIAILDMLPSSDHIPLSFVFDFMCTPTFIATYTCPSNKVNFNWTKATDKDLIDYKYLTRYSYVFQKYSCY